MTPVLLAQAVNYSYSVNANGNPMLGLAGAAVGLVIGLAFYAVISWLLSNDLTAVPEGYRQNVTPGQCWLLMIPLFNLVWNFILFPRLTASFAAYFEGTGRPKPGDYGRSLALAFSIAAACCIIPCVNFLAAPAALVMLIVLLVKFNGYKDEIRGGGFPVQPTSGELPPSGTV